MHRPSRLFLIAVSVPFVLLTAVPAAAQVFVYPRRPGQTNVRFDDFKWRHVNILTGPESQVETSDPGPRGGADPVSFERKGPGDEMLPRYPLHHPVSSGGMGGGFYARSGAGDSSASEAESRIEKLAKHAGGLRLFYYESEEEVTERATPAIEESYRALMGSFDFAPPKTFPFILYNSYHEFLQTNLFPIQEGVLGVTSPRNLLLTLPYFGDHRQFERVAHHELVHEFTIQKVRTIASQNETFRDPIEGIPLWFIEGLAEYYTHGGLDPETKMLARDLAVHQAPRRGYVLGDFFQRGPRSYLWIYKLGQVRCAFLEETYGSGTLQEILNRSYRLGRGQWQKNRIDSFEALVQNVTKEKPKVLSAKFENWLKESAYNTYLDASQKHGEFPQLDKINRYIRGLDSSDDGNILLYKTVDLSTGQNRLFLADRRDLTSEKQLAIDGNPGLESLHPLESKSFDLHDSNVVFVARAKARDVLYRQSYSVKKQTLNKHDPDEPSKPPEKERRIRIKTGKRIGYSLGDKGVFAVESPRFGPDGERIAFLGMDKRGQKDIYVLTPQGDGEFDLTRVTDDVYAERGLSWGENGLVFGSDETGHGRYNLFQVAPNPGAEPERITSSPRDHFEPVVLPDGRILFVTYNDSHANLHKVTDKGAVKLTDVTTGLFNPSPGPNGGVWSLFHYAGQRVPVQLTAQKLEEREEVAAAPDVPTSVFETRSLEESQPYKPLALRNWRLNNGFGILGITSEGFFGQLYASAGDRLRNHQLLLELIAFGSFDRTDGALTYINQENRVIWGLSLFQDFRYRVDETFQESQPDLNRFISFERFYGGRGLFRYPFSRFFYAQLALAAGGTTYFLGDDTRKDLENATPPDDRALDTQWDNINNSPRFQTEGEFSLGLDTIHYERATGPVSGYSLLGSVTGDYQPFEDTAFGSVRLDGEFYVPIYERINLFFRAGGGDSFGDRLARQFFLSSFYTLRGVPFGDTDFLLGENFFFSTLEFQFPINFLIRIPFIDLEGIAGVDFGGVGDSYPGLWDNRVLNAAFGVNFGFGPIVFRLHFAKPFDIGVTVPNDGKWVPNLSLGWRYL